MDYIPIGDPNHQSVRSLARAIDFFARAVVGVTVFLARVAASRWLFVSAEFIVAFAGLRVRLSPSVGCIASKSENTSSMGRPSMVRLSRNALFITLSSRCLNPRLNPGSFRFPRLYVSPHDIRSDGKFAKLSIVLAIRRQLK